MKIGDYALNKYSSARLSSQNSKTKENISVSDVNDKNDDKELKKAVSNFSAVFLNQMFKSMKKTLPENKLIDGGFAEDIFTDMMYSEISKSGARQQGFDSLNNKLYQQLTRNTVLDE